MKIQVITVLLIVLMLHNLFGKILNGYEKDVATAQLTIKHIRQLLAENPQFSDKHKKVLNARIAELTDYLIYHRLTDTLLNKFHAIAPDLYAAIDTLKDHKSRNVDVYVKFIPKSKAKIESLGEVMLGVARSHDNICTSAYGMGSVSVSIRILTNSLSILSHEFGHLLYIVPNIARYVTYYKGAYRTATAYQSLGHACTDPGGRNAIRLETQYRQRYHRYLRGRNEKVLPFAYMAQARLSVQRELAYSTWQLAGAVTGPLKF